jgi:hypothetical protein
MPVRPVAFGGTPVTGGAQVGEIGFGPSIGRSLNLRTATKEPCPSVHRLMPPAVFLRNSYVKGVAFCREPDPPAADTHVLVAATQTLTTASPRTPVGHQPQSEGHEMGYLRYELNDDRTAETGAHDFAERWP